MHELTVESAFGEQLSQLSGQTVLCDCSGRVLGFFSPLPGRPAVADLQLESPTPIAELQERRKQRTGKPLSEILARLGLS
jgi:hypothetical protein